MKRISFNDLYTLDFDLSNLFSMRQHWRENTVFKMNKPRPTSVLMWFNDCDGIYTDVDGHEVDVPKGSVIYIPEGAMYSWRFVNCKQNSAVAVIIEFSITVNGENFAAGATLLKLSDEVDPVTKERFLEAADLFSAPVISPSAVKSIVYRLLYDFSRRQRRHSMKSREFSSIAKGISYLETDTRQEKSVKEIAEMCHVSEGTFRRLFKKYSGLSPIEYREKARMEYAKKLLSQNTMTVYEVSQAVGIEDSAYFCRIFKKRCGLTPTRFAAKK